MLFRSVAKTCNPGEYLSNGNCVQASPGHFALGGTATSQTDCVLGTSWQNIAGAIACLAVTPCTTGFFTGRVATTQSNTGCTPFATPSCAPGYYVSEIGVTGSLVVLGQDVKCVAATSCGENEYVSVAGKVGSTFVLGVKPTCKRSEEHTS